MNSLGVISYNMGTNIKDFAWECDYLKEKIDDGEISQKKYQEAQENTTKSLVGRASVYLLQEVGMEDRPLAIGLKLAGYAMFHILNHLNVSEKVQNRRVFDAAIFLKQDEFMNVENHSKMIDGWDVAIVSATHTLTGERITFASAHVPGFSLDEEKLCQADMRDGGKYCRIIIETVLAIKDSTIHIIGADMNANPEVLVKAGEKSERTWTHCFEKFNDAGFETYRTDKSTNVKPDSDYCKREIDFIFARAVLTQEKTTRLLKWDSSLNASDHRPVLTKFLL